MPELLQPYFAWPTLPFSVLLCLVLAYWLLMIVSGIDLDFLDFDFDVDTDIDSDGSIFDWGMVGLKWFNLGHVPLMLWVSIFALVAWLMSITFDQPGAPQTTQEFWTSTLRNIGVALFAAKAVTQPLKDKFKVIEPNTVADMLGRECVITTTEADESYGQAQCKADGAPLVLNVRTLEGSIPKGDVVHIVDYSPDEKVYIVQPVQNA